MSLKQADHPTRSLFRLLGFGSDWLIGLLWKWDSFHISDTVLTVSIKKKTTHVEQTQLTYWVKHSYILYSLWINILKHTFLYFQNISAHPASLHSYVCKTSYFKSGNIFFDIVRIKFVKKKKILWRINCWQGIFIYLFIRFFFNAPNAVSEAREIIYFAMERY